jgi:hypothetical protein
VTQNFSLKSAIASAKDNTLHEWVYSFLHTVGKNKGMAKGMLRRKEEQKLFWVGPINFPLKQLTRCTGPEKNMEYPQSIKSWENRVGAMIKSIKRGWEAPILIINPRPWPTLSIRDGNHRYEALLRSGKRKYWAIFWFENQRERSKFINKYKVPKRYLHYD